MKRTYETGHPAIEPRHRSGVTLVEVLVSVMIMSIGVILLATLIPISIARTAQASQLTQSVFLRNNVEAVARSTSGLFSTNTIDPEPTDALFNTAVLNLPGGLSVIDPLGLNAGLPSTFAGVGTLQRRRPLSVTKRFAQQLVTLPDSWTDMFDATVTGSSNTGGNFYVTATNPSQFQLSDFNLSNNSYRLLLFDAPNTFDPTGKLVATRTLTGVSATSGTITKYSYANPLPVTFSPGRVRVEVQVQRFTSMLTVIKSPLPSSSGNTWQTDISVAVFYNRAFSQADETPSTLTFNDSNTYGGFDNAYGVANVDDNNDGIVDNQAEQGWPGSDDDRTFVVTSGIPYRKKGSYLLDTSLLNWYRIVDFDKNGNILVDREIITNPALTAANIYTTSAVFMKGIVEVYPIGVVIGQN